MKKIITLLFATLFIATSCFQEESRFNTEFFDGHVKLGYVFSEEDQEFMESLSEGSETEMEDDRMVRTYTINASNYSQPFDYVRVHTKNKVICAIEFQHYDENKTLNKEYTRMIANVINDIGDPDERDENEKDKIALWRYRNTTLNAIRSSGPSNRQLELARLFNVEPEETNYIIMLLVDNRNF